VLAAPVDSSPELLPCSQRAVGYTSHSCMPELGSAACHVAHVRPVLRSGCCAFFLQLPATAIEGSSLLFRSLLRDACLEHGPIFDAFLNRLFNTLNWTVTEFVVVLKVLPFAIAVYHGPTYMLCLPNGAPRQSVVGCQAAQASTFA
jgi:hypothetical protein